jgi:hypothetical protein
MDPWMNPQEQESSKQLYKLESADEIRKKREEDLKKGHYSPWQKKRAAHHVD